MTPGRTATVSRKSIRPRPAVRPARAAAPGRPSISAVTAKRPDTIFGRIEPTKREIRDRAYFIYLARGGVNGDPVSDWLRAERELRDELYAAAHAGRRF